MPAVSSTPPAPPLFEPRVRYGQGKTAMTILTEGGYTYPVIHEPYSHRAHYGPKARHQEGVPEAPSSGRVRRGERPMHRSTLTISKPPWEPDFTTTNKHGQPLRIGVVSASDSRSGGRGSHSRPCHVAIPLGKQFTQTFPSPPTCKMGTQLQASNVLVCWGISGAALLR
ncbi:hypothetical protein ElyMa_004925500 [Elysia marginata]|uniref:Uncharacterized protein n=1 Tax=Elysia marginata TaxID=1093978 RepID=A0AAV4J0G1_9GAST|nr:hypothetical protein ElyMa_004925500 [Elysia marginata]